MCFHYFNGCKMKTDIYKNEMQNVLRGQKNLTIVEASVEDLLLDDSSSHVRGITTGAGDVGDSVGVCVFILYVI